MRARRAAAQRHVPSRLTYVAHIAALAAGVCVDALIARLDAGPGKVHSHLIIGGAMPLLLWSAWFLVAKVVSDVVWVAGAWSGTIVMCSLIGWDWRCSRCRRSAQRRSRMGRPNR